MEGEILKRELKYQKTVAKKQLKGIFPIPDYIINRYRESKNWKIFPKEYIFKEIKKLAEDSNNILNICDFGCGDAINSCQTAKIVENVKLCAFDISPELVDIVEKRVKLNGLSNKVDFFVGDAEKDALKGKAFDVMLVLSILHHIDIKKAMPKLLAATKPGGTIIIKEPIAFSKSLQFLRDLTPVSKDVSPDERQLTEDEIKYLEKSLDNPTIIYFGLVARLIRLLPNRNKIDQGHPFTKGIVHTLSWLDWLIFKTIPYLKKYSGTVLIIGKNPVISSPDT